MAYKLKSMNLSVHEHVHHHQTIKLCAHEMKWFHSKKVTLFLILCEWILLWQAHGVKQVFTLVGGHISPILVACEKLGIRVVDTRHEVGFNNCIYWLDDASQ